MHRHDINEIGLVNELEEVDIRQEFIDAYMVHYNKVLREREAEVIKKVFGSPAAKLIDEVNETYKERLVTPEEQKFIFEELA